MSPHTPGPWTIQPLMTEHHGYADWPTFAIRSPHNVCLAVVGEVDHFRERGAVQSERTPANARLIAAAPDLLAFVRSIAETPCDHGAQPCCPRETARSLLARVRDGS